MSNNNKLSDSKTIFWLGVGVCAGIGGLLYLNEVRAKAERLQRTVPTYPSASQPEVGDILLFHKARSRTIEYLVVNVPDE